mgnify:CR=1 FL=1
MPQYRKINIPLHLFKGKRYLKPTRYPSIPLRNDDIQILTDSGDRLDNLAYQFYGDTSYWIWIVLANPSKVRRDGYYISPGTQLRIPRNIEEIVTKFEKLNK